MEVWPLTLQSWIRTEGLCPPTPFLNKWEFYRIMVLEHIDWPQPGCTSPSLETVKPVMGWTQWGCDWHVPRAFGAQGCTLLGVLQPWEGGVTGDTRQAWHDTTACSTNIHNPASALWGCWPQCDGLLCCSARTEHEAVCPCPRWGDSACAGGTDSALHRTLQDSAKWGCGKLATAFCLTTYQEHWIR